MKTLSILIPTYNVSAYIGKCIESLLIDDIDDLDILVINDGSKDNSSEIAHQYARRYPNSIRVIDKENGNYGSCINRGLREAKGKYIKILDGDDTFDSTAFAEYVSLLKKTNADLILNDYVRVNTEGKRIWHGGYSELKSGIDLDIEELNDCFPYDSITMAAVAYKTSIFNGLNYHQTEGISYTDDEWIFLPITRVKKVVYYPIPLYKYLIGRDGQTIQNTAIIKNIGHIAKIVLNMVDMYSKLQATNTFQIEYLKRRLKSKTYILYNACLIHYRLIDNFSISDFDKNLKDHFPSIYNLFEEVKITIFKIYRFKYIKVWRESGFDALPLKLARVWYKIVKLIKG